MNRPTIFRGMNYLGQWRYGHYTIVKRLSRLEPTIFECMNPEDDERQGQWAVKGETVGMGTGMKEKNGKEMFEGDVIRHQTTVGSPWYWEIVFLSGCFWCYNKDHHTTNQMYSWPEHCYPMFRVNHEVYSEIIGNVHENPDLRDKVRKTTPNEVIKSHGL